jgi:hypothetical protein
MATTNNAITVTGGLTCSALSSPPIGVTGVSASLAYTDGDAASDTYVNVSATTTPGTALHTDLAADGFVFVFVPSDGQKVTIYSGTTLIGPIPPGFGVPIPVGSGVVLKGVVASGTQMVGVVALKTSANA